ncbi:MAG TPA: glycosyl hydrolase 115 family protein [Candidatus Eisenbergiella merdavium]|uniref:Glycosyl hydrolase 115 family protein n=1 Tax=Candidatus Eisenbergiella merdavium TaxID=2838551 RepID=A0A9D2NEZ0_9FIRM|nr:glycosyl hydrolase 115 family protein [Candidatus Eisenbergiella merdavium]
MEERDEAMTAEKRFLLKRGEKVRLFCAEEENSAVRHAVGSLAGDMERACGCVVEWGNGQPSSDETVVVAVTAGTPWFDRMIPEGTGIGLDRLKDDRGELRWEAYLQQVCEGTLFLIGADRRGTVYAVYDLCEQLGVSPWYFWGDVPVRKKDSFTLPEDYIRADWPDVAYRGIFLNDEEELDAWAKRHTKDGTIGPETYRAVYELILRLKGNYIWPAMHVNYFNENPENGRLAEEMGVVVGTSHCDMLLRSNQNEWKPWLEKKGYQGVKYDYSIPGKNREQIREYWKESVEMNRAYEVTYTVGMRGIHDSGFVTERIDLDPALSETEKTEKKIRMLGEVIRDQRQIIRETLGEEKASRAVQTFIPYKEVLSLYDQGLDVPEDITLIWVDDNFGYMRRYPNERERCRKGGNGLYYHASYWASPGMSYLFFNSIPLAQTGNELKKCWESGIQRLWVLNVGALKPLELDLEFFLRYAWSAGRECREAKEAQVFVEEWINRNFSGKKGKRAAEVYGRFAQLNNVCKPEHLKAARFSQTSYGNEAARRLEELGKLVREGERIWEELPEQEREAFFELFLMKLQASFFINASFYYADRSCLCWERGAMRAADGCTEVSRRMDRKKKELLYYYNEVLKEGKWSGILTPESFSPPPTALFPAARPALTLGEPGLGAVWEELIFYAHGRERKRLTLFNRGSKAVRFWLEAPDWLETGQTQGTVETELVLFLCVRKDREAFRREREGKLILTGSAGERYEVPVKIRREADYSPAGGSSFYAEADGYVSIPADGYTAGRVEEDGSVSCFQPDTETDPGQKTGAVWRRIKYLGRGWGDAMEAFLPESDRHGEETVPDERSALEYAFFLEKEGAHLLEIHRFLTLKPKGRIRMGVVVDGGRPIILEAKTVDEWMGNWRDAVMEDGEKLYATLPWLSSGLHRLQIFPIDGYLTLSRYVIYTAQRQENDLGPADSAFFDGNGWRKGREETEELPDLTEEENAFWRRVYGSPDEAAMRLPMLYAGPDFWKTERLYAVSDEREDVPGRKKYDFVSGERKDLLCRFGSGIFEECAGEIFIEAEYALEKSQNAWLTSSVPDGKGCWMHIRSETDGGTGLAMISTDMGGGEGMQARIPMHAAGMHYRFRIHNPADYTIWLLMRFEDTDSDYCETAVDGMIREADRAYAPGGGFFSYSMKQRWHWRAVSRARLEEGIHTLSLYGTKPGLQIDRIYLTASEDWPPVDTGWKESREAGEGKRTKKV